MPQVDILWNIHSPGRSIFAARRLRTRVHAAQAATKTAARTANVMMSGKVADWFASPSRDAGVIVDVGLEWCEDVLRVV